MPFTDSRFMESGYCSHSRQRIRQSAWAWHCKNTVVSDSYLSIPSNHVHSREHENRHPLADFMPSAKEWAS